MRIRAASTVAMAMIFFLFAVLSGRVAISEDGEKAAVVSPEAKLAAKAIQVPQRTLSRRKDDGFTVQPHAADDIGHHRVVRNVAVKSE